MDEIYHKYAGMVYKFLLARTGKRDLAEELTQETFYRAVYSLKTYDGTCRFSTWLCQIAKHVWMQELEKRKKHQADKQEYLEGEAHVTSEEVRKIKPGMTAGEIQELLGITAACYEGGSLDYSLGYIVDEEYLIEIIFSTLNEEQPCGMTGDEILAAKVPKGESRFGQ
ncbi:RNA polymerase sigma factor [Clostridium transplantifaecale]|uniref:RNA polymerase sigma factor n=1 Tax=Clostridium transplantifaecale TaxID=2479838 RepID=UPI001FA9A301|nr:sigma factor [Clostridium transplantifaecale]